MDKTKTVGICLMGVVIAIIAVTIFKVSLSIIGTTAVLLACPLLHFWMMKDGNHKH